VSWGETFSQSIGGDFPHEWGENTDIIPPARIFSPGRNNIPAGGDSLPPGNILGGVM